MPIITGAQTSHASAQFLNSVLSQRGPNALPYDEGMKWSIRQHLLTLLQDFPGLQVKTANFTHNDGRTVNLLQADGTIPMYFQDVKYNIPIVLWLLEAYPRNCPLVYVTPTRDMIIKPRHTYVDASGMVNIPYLQQWVYPRSNLVELIQSTSLLFGQDPPLYSRPAVVTHLRPPPPLPPTPSFHGMNPMHASTSAAASASVVQTASPTANSFSPIAQPPPRALYPPYTQHSPTATTTALPLQVPRTESPAEVFKKNAINALSERVVRDTSALLRQSHTEMDGLFHTQALLNQRAEQVEKGFREMQQEREGLEQQLQLLLTNTDVIESWLKINDRGMMDVEIDDVFEPTDALSKQMLECTSGDLAIEDILYSLDRAVRDGAIPVDAYLKHVRMLSREQFMFRATTSKIRQLQTHSHVVNMASRSPYVS
ncbi:ESCRT-I complex subunit TSG101 [Marchantia polymorpha subsp. ruderalis]|uniref:UEV domain-containing protein n=1 Tax=Marchantia polymorpha TaxID=3197 RepID=A0A2R6X8B5_MARPO|nr:hypothetical protein MARPO_0030s0083 [Marchantia polymorpha]BBN20228.1 hypothetical protein Mp_8g17490 [Marchantia polymorpha subsp. ruderalis]|eukprot:PTQ42346.1 hypothetical protein MARPO_0030s0083 [Marchantia polymorpha]